MTDWQPMDTAPKDTTEVEVKMADGTIHGRAHWACDMSGEEQPAFRGWFIWRGSYFDNIGEPIAWRPIVEGSNHG